jgi:hypothetical protein
MASASVLRGYRKLFLIVTMVLLLVSIALGALRTSVVRVTAPPTRIAEEEVAPPEIRVPIDHDHLKAPPREIAPHPKPLPVPARTAPPSQSDLPLLGACASLSAALLTFLGFLVTSFMALRKERRDNALFAVDLEMKRLQLAEMQARVVRSA